MNMKTEHSEGILTIFPEGRITAENAAAFEGQLMTAAAAAGENTLMLDFSDLAYISSAGLRVLLKLRKACTTPVPIVNCSPEVYDILEMTGFTELFDVRKALREISIEGLPQIGRGANGTVYRLDDERIIKVYNPLTNTLEKIQREKKAARAALLHDIPTAISFEIVKVDDRYGMIYEMIQASTVGELLGKEPERVDEYAIRMADLLRKLHTTAFEPGTLPDAREGLYAWADIAEKSGWYSEEIIERLRRLIGSIPPGNTFVHGDYHPGNVMVSGGELLLIDMGDASVGDPLIDLLGSYQIMKLAASRKGGAERYIGASRETMARFWDVFIRRYSGITDEAAITQLEQKLKYYALIRSMAGITFSELIPEEARPSLVKQVTEAFLGQ